jgi:hypothetical protein
MDCEKEKRIARMTEKNNLIGKKCERKADGDRPS